MQNIRWRILALLFFATTINYLDRILLGFLLPAIRQETHITDQEYGYITGAFQVALHSHLSEFKKSVKGKAKMVYICIDTVH